MLALIDDFVVSCQKLRRKIWLQRASAQDPTSTANHLKQQQNLTNHRRRTGTHGSWLDLCLNECVPVDAPSPPDVDAMNDSQLNKFKASLDPDLESLTSLMQYIEVVQRPLLPSLVKRLMDLAVAMTMLILAAPLMILIAIAIKLSSRGPVLFCQTRIGRGGLPFKIYKFRSMLYNAEDLKASLEQHNETDGPIFKMRADPRITVIGRWLRRYSLDELPQLFNIVLNDMSLVGPRPPVPKEVVKYAPWQLRRLSVTPGLTCIWQTSGRSHVSFEEWMRMDLSYIDQWSLGLDIMLLIKTVKTVALAEGAY